MTFLLDTSVISAFAPGRPALSAGLKRWIELNSAGLYLSAMSVTEIEQGLCKLRRSGSLLKSARLSEWLDELLRVFGDRVVTVDPSIARATGKLSDHAAAAGQTPGLVDIIIAATAADRGLVLLTQNLKHFEPLARLWAELTCVDPFIKLPDR